MLTAASKSVKPEETSFLLNSFARQVTVQSGRQLKLKLLLLVVDAKWVITHLAEYFTAHHQDRISAGNSLSRFPNLKS